MGSIWGNKLKISIFGESHGPAIGVVLDGLPSGIELDFSFIAEELKRRAPGRDPLSTARREADSFEILSGFFEGRTTGTPLCAITRNKDQQPGDYGKIKNIPRPGHADYTGFVRYKGFNDYRGGGHFSGRLTAPLVFAGAVAKIVLQKRGIFIGSHIKSIKDLYDDSFDGVNVDKNILDLLRRKELEGKSLPTLNEVTGIKMTECILNAKKKMDSVGGVIETAVINLPPGLGSPFFDSVESRLAHVLFSIPAVKGVEFGEGFKITKMFGSQANDGFLLDGGKIKTATNHNGGILGGITNGMPLLIKVAVKPTPSVGREQCTVDIVKMQETTLTVQGRHDPCIVPRALPAVEAATALVILDLMLETDAGEGGKHGGFKKIPGGNR